MSAATCPGEIVTGASGEALCQDMGGAPLAWTVQPAFDVANLDPVRLSGAFAAGFVIVATGWVIGRGFRVVLSMIR